MIDPVSSGIASQAFIRPSDVGSTGALPVGDLAKIGIADDSSGGKKPDTFSSLIGNLINEVDTKTKAAETETRHLMLGESNNIHRSMIAMQESGIAFSLLVEVRNKLVESYQELMRMPV